MSQFTFFIKLPPYLGDWYRNRCGGTDPIKPIKGSQVSDIIKRFVALQPKDTLPQLYPKEGEVAIEIPENRIKPAEFYNHMPPRAKEAVLETIRLEFTIELWEDINSFKNLGKQRDKLIYAWMEEHGIKDTETNYLAIAKIYQRKRDTARNRYRQQKRRNDKKKK